MLSLYSFQYSIEENVSPKHAIMQAHKRAVQQYAIKNIEKLIECVSTR